MNNIVELVSSRSVKSLDWNINCLKIGQKEDVFPRNTIWPALPQLHSKICRMNLEGDSALEEKLLVAIKQCRVTELDSLPLRRIAPSLPRGDAPNCHRVGEGALDSHTIYGTQKRQNA
ncbi:MAG: hypothetical protein ACOH1R_07585 [Luteimonas sp.]